MTAADILSDALGGDLSRLVSEETETIAELRLRVDRPAYLVLKDGRKLTGECTDAHRLNGIICRLMNHSIYAHEDELRHGYFTAGKGLRVGVCGTTSIENGRILSMENISSVCIRVPHEIKGCGTALAEQMKANGLKSLLVVSPPGMGKTTLLRDIARIISESGFNVGVADERREFAACVEGRPSLDIGPQTDVMDACPKVSAIQMLVRCCAPDLIVADEIGSAEEAEALCDAARCGVCIAASAHAYKLEEAQHRAGIGRLIQEGIFDLCAVLGGGRGRIRAIHEMRSARG